jgi:hypothetical protein
MIIDKHESNMQMAIFAFGVVEMCIGLSCAIAADLTSTFNLLVFFSGISGVLAVAFCVLNPINIKVYDVLGMALMLAYGTGTLNSFVTYTIDHKDFLLSSSVTEYWLTRTLGLVTAATGLLHVVGRFDSKGYLFPRLSNSIDLQENRALLLVGVVAVIAIAFIATGKLGFMASLTAVEGYVGISSSASVILDLMSPAGALAMYLGRKEEQKKWRGILFITLAIVLLLIQFGLGRRIFVFSLLIYVMAAIVAKRPKAIFSVRNILATVALAMLVQVATSAFYTLRIARYTFKDVHKTPSIVEMIPEAIRIYKDRERLFLAEQIHENVGSRTFVLEYLATLSERTSIIEPAYGENLLRAVVVSAPSALYWSKYKNPLFGSEEDLLNPHFRLPVWDAANSVLTASVGDFGEIGFFLLPVLLCFIFSRFLLLGYALTTPIAGMLISFFICKVLLSVEDDIVSYFTAARSVFILIGITWLAFKFKKTISTQLSFKDKSETVMGSNS